MLITKPAYFDSFRCIAGLCPDSCCKEWDVLVDDDAAACYRALPGDLGDRLREVLTDTEEGTVMAIVEGRCPMWRQDGLCRIQAELGEQALCRVCTEFPRLRHDYGDFVELGLELSCPEAARILFSAPDLPPVCQNLPGDEIPEYDTEAMAVLKATRQKALALLSLPSYSVKQKLTLLLLYGYQAQGQLDGNEAAPFSPADTLVSAAQFAREGSMTEIADFFSSLEILNPQWPEFLKQVGMPRPEEICLILARYLVERYWLQAVSDYDLACRVKFMVVFCLLVSSLPGDFVTNAQRCSKEIENNADNVEALLDAAYSHRSFTDDRILGLLQ
jgi:lysine-N-methylase